MKHNHAEQARTEADRVTLPGADSEAQYATVYTFVIWDHDRGSTAIYPRMATREAIAKMRGKVNEDSAWVVEAAALDVEGFYSAGPVAPVGASG